MAYTILEVEAALCLWEEVVANRTDTPWQPFLETYGTVELRHQIIKVASECSRIWGILYDEDLADAFIPFDWEWCPFFLREIVEWDGSGATVPADALERIRSTLN